MFSKIYLVRDYYDITTPFGLYEYLHMPFGLMSAAQTFQILMDTVFRNVSCVFVPVLL